MATRTATLIDRITTQPTASIVFLGLALALLAIAVGHLYLLRGLATLYLGLPLWLWLQLVVVFAMVGIAWIAVRVVALASSGGG